MIYIGVTSNRNQSKRGIAKVNITFTIYTIYNYTLL